MTLTDLAFSAGGGFLFGSKQNTLYLYSTEYDIMPKGVYSRPVIIRKCLACGKRSVYTNGRDLVRWDINRDESGHEINALCRPCNARIIYNPLHSQDNQIKRITFRSSRIYLETSPRRGICTRCGKRRRTLMHHERYDELNPANHIIEMCFSCHSRIHWKERRQNTFRLRFGWKCYGCGISYIDYIKSKGRRYVLNPPTNLFLCRNCAWTFGISKEGREYHAN